MKEKKQWGFWFSILAWLLLGYAFAVILVIGVLAVPFIFSGI